MSHVDDGTLHAYLDGELSPVEVGRLDAHLAECQRAAPGWRRNDADRAGEQPGTPRRHTQRAATPLHQLRRPRAAWSIRLPLAWAATLFLAVGVGWVLRGRTSALRLETSDSRLDSAPPVQPAAEAPSLALDSRPPVTSAGRAEQRRRNEAESTQGALTAFAAPEPAAREETDDRHQVAKVVDQVAQAPANRGLEAAPPAPVTGDARAGAMAPLDAARDAPARKRLSTVWPVIEPQPARDLLGAEPATIPGIPIRTMRRNPAASEILVEQDLGNGVFVQLFERRMVAAGEVSPSGRRDANERLARFVGPLRIEIAGPLPPDSLNKLLQRAQ
jgi:hypothetical protein